MTETIPETEASIRGILSAWTDLNVSRAGDAWVIAGRYNGKAHAGGRIDGVSLAEDLKRIAEAEDAPRPISPALAEDEDPGEQDLGAEMLAAEEEVLLEAAPLVDGVGDGHSESPANPGTSETEHYANDADRGSLAASEEPQHLAAESHPAADDGASYESDVDVVPGDAHVESYPGIAILPDELGARRNAVLAAIATEKLTRLSIAMDPSRADFLATRFADYQNAGALGLPIDEALAADYRAFQELRDRRDRITNYAMQLEQSALDGDMDRLEAMHAGLGDGWP